MKDIDWNFIYEKVFSWLFNTVLAFIFMVFGFSVLGVTIVYGKPEVAGYVFVTIWLGSSSFLFIVDTTIEAVLHRQK